MRAPSDDEWDRIGASADHDRTTLDQRADQPSDVLDRTMRELEQASAPADHNATVAGMGVGTPRPERLVLLDPNKGKVPLEKERVLSQPERSPLDFVMRDMDPAAPAKSHTSGDSSRFVAAFVDAPPPQVEAEAPVITAMEPVLRRSRRRRMWLGASVLAVAAVLGTGFAVMTGKDDAPRTAASETEKVADTPAPPPAPAVAPAPAAAPVAPPPTVAPAAQDVAAPTAEPPPPPPTAQPEVVAMAAPVAAPKVAHTKPAVAKKTTVATKEPTATKSTTAKKKTTTTKKKATTKTAAKPSSKTSKTPAKTAKKSSTTKKSSSTKKTTKKTVKKSS